MAAVETFPFYASVSILRFRNDDVHFPVRQTGSEDRHWSPGEHRNASFHGQEKNTRPDGGLSQERSSEGRKETQWRTDRGREGAGLLSTCQLHLHTQLFQRQGY